MVVVTLESLRPDPLALPFWTSRTTEKNWFRKRMLPGKTRMPKTGGGVTVPSSICSESGTPPDGSESTWSRTGRTTGGVNRSSFPSICTFGGPIGRYELPDWMQVGNSIRIVLPWIARPNANENALKLESLTVIPRAARSCDVSALDVIWVTRMSVTTIVAVG